MKQLKGLTDNLVEFDGTALQDGAGGPLTIKNTILLVLKRGQTAEPVHAIDVAWKFEKAGDTLVLDDADVALALAGVRADRGLVDLAKAQVLKVLEAATEYTAPPAE